MESNRIKSNQSRLAEMLAAKKSLSFSEEIKGSDSRTLIGQLMPVFCFLAATSSDENGNVQDDDISVCVRWNCKVEKGKGTKVEGMDLPGERARGCMGGACDVQSKLPFASSNFLIYF